MTFPLFEKVGGQTRAMDIVERALGKRPSEYAQIKWRTEKALPAKIAVPLLIECGRKGIAFSERDMLIQPATARRPSRRAA